MSYRRKTESVLWPVIFIATDCGTPTRTRFLTAVRRRSCENREFPVDARVRRAGIESRRDVLPHVAFVDRAQAPVFEERRQMKGDAPLYIGQ
jgi:hypothetical protein